MERVTYRDKSEERIEVNKRNENEQMTIDLRESNEMK